MRHTGHSLNRTVKELRARHKAVPTLTTALDLAETLALRTEYENTVHARVEIPGLALEQRSLSTVLTYYRQLRKLPGVPPGDLKRLRAAIKEARKVPVYLPAPDFTA